MSSTFTPAGTASSSKTTLWGPALLMTHVTESPLQILVFFGTKMSWPESSPILTVAAEAANAGLLTVENARPGEAEGARQRRAARAVVVAVLEDGVDGLVERLLLRHREGVLHVVVEVGHHRHNALAVVAHVAHARAAAVAGRALGAGEQREQ